MHLSWLPFSSQTSLGLGLATLDLVSHHLSWSPFSSQTSLGLGLATLDLFQQTCGSGLQYSVPWCGLFSQVGLACRYRSI